MAVNPYIGAQASQTLQDALMQGLKATREAQTQLTAKKGQMKTEYDADLRESQKRMEEQLAKKRKKKPWEKLVSAIAPIVSFFNPLAGTIMGGISGASKAIGDVKMAKENIALAEQMGLDMDKYKGTFLQGGAQTADDTMMGMLQTARESIDDDPLKMLGAGLSEGLSARGIGTGLTGVANLGGGSILEGLGSGFKNIGKGGMKGLAKAFTSPQGLSDKVIAGTLTTEELLEALEALSMMQEGKR